MWVWRASLCSVSRDRFVHSQRLPARPRLLSMVQWRRKSDRCLWIDLRRTRYSRDLCFFCCSPRPALASRVTAKTLVRDALRRDALASSPVWDHHARSSIDNLSGDPPFPRPLRIAGTPGSMLLRLLSLISPLATSPPDLEIKRGDDSSVKLSIQGIEVSPQSKVPPVRKAGFPDS
jgi:hypothetical protein